MRGTIALSLLVVVTGCSTVGVRSDERPYAIVEPTIAYEMMLDHKQIVVLDVRPIEEFYGELGHIGGALSVPIDRAEERLGEIMPYRSQTVLIYGYAQEEVQRAIEVLTGEFEIFREEDVTVDTILASAAEPSLFNAVPINGKVYWDGLFSKNPPVQDFNVAPDLPDPDE
ncbi:MAG: rhodanese-like domain-containing protein, partial [Thermoanaerobaculia bacterium]|nr:rhodanese-like domain-containing protein [Thermoanaerobaculia bacterium]